MPASQVAAGIGVIKSCALGIVHTPSSEPTEHPGAPLYESILQPLSDSVFTVSLPWIS